MSLATLKVLFEDTYEDSDLLTALEEAGGDLELAIARISEGQISTWGKVKTKTTVRAVRGRGQRARGGRAGTSSIKKRLHGRSKYPSRWGEC